ncbi:glutathione-disulfide reductase [Insolitispirillum peregrinum]|uniref:glutathione-disulfide reductase n=1 Tax=Insolitispirillum peregrinum TaxID=80876 RepID=UPI00360880F9
MSGSFQRTTRYDYDLITIGAGSGGVRASRLAGGYGAKVAVVEEKAPGGTCVLRGCVPKKLLVYGAHFAEEMEDARGYGWTIGEASFDWGALIAAKNTELKRLEGVYERILRGSGVDILQGRGVVVDPHTVQVGDRTYTAERILIAVGGWPSLPAVPGHEHVITSNEALDLPELPASIAIVGGGFIALEFAGIFNALGSDVTVIIRGDEVLRGFDQDVRSHLAHEMERKGIRIRRETRVQSIEPTADGQYSVLLSTDEELVVAKVMYATGRAPNTRGLGLEAAGVELDPKSGAIKVDEWSRTSVPSIWAVGDVTDRVNLTPVALNEGRCFAETEFNNNPLTMTHANVPAAVFTQPPVGTVGLTEEQARARGPVDIYLSRFRPMKYTLSGREEKTLMKLIVDRETQVVLGAHMVGVDAPEILQGFGVAVRAGLTKQQFDACVGIHPTAAEEFVTMRDKLPDPSPECSE